MVSKLEQFSERLLVKSTQLKTWLFHQPHQNCEGDVLLHIDSNQDQTRQVIHSLAVAHVGVMLAVSNQNVEECILAICHLLREEISIDEGPIHIFLNLMLVLQVLHSGLGQVVCFREQALEVTGQNLRLVNVQQ